jgi:hypothetical protein
VVSEVLNWRLNRRQNKDTYFWRDSNGQEIDLLIEENGSLLPIECRAGQTIAADWLGSIEKFLDVTGSNQAWLIYGGDHAQQRKQVQSLAGKAWQRQWNCEAAPRGGECTNPSGLLRCALKSPPGAARNWAGVTMRKPDLASE